MVAKYLLLFSLTGETIKGFIAKPSDRAAVVRELTESVGGGLESYYWMFGQYDGAAIVSLPDSHTAAAISSRSSSRCWLTTSSYRRRATALLASMLMAHLLVSWLVAGNRAKGDVCSGA